MEQAISRVKSWIDRPCVRFINPTESHWRMFQTTLHEGQTMANLVPDACLATLAVEYGCLLYSTDSDFSRFPKPKWKNPLKTKK
jgi:predicted nucleic acid-binding protein